MKKPELLEQIQLLFFVVALPLLLTLAAAWLAALVAGIDPGSAWSLPGGFMLSRASVARFLAGFGLVSALAALAVGSWSLWDIRRAGRKARESREALLREFRRGLARLPWRLGALGAFLALALTAVVACFVLLFLWPHLNFHRRVDFYLIAMAGLALLAWLYFGVKLIVNIHRMSRLLLEIEPLTVPGRRVAEAEAPQLWAMVASLAEKIGTEPPRHLAAGLEGGCFVTEHPALLAEAEEPLAGRLLYLSLADLAFLTRLEAEAVIGHELAHFAGEDTEYSRHFGPIHARVAANLAAVHLAEAGEDGPGVSSLAGKPTRLLGEFFLQAFHQAVGHWSRERELAADRRGAAVADPAAQGRALLKISLLRPLIGRVLAEGWESGAAWRGDVLARLTRLAEEQGGSDPAALLGASTAHPTDSHPPTRQRLEALGLEATAEFLESVARMRPTGLLRELGLEIDSSGEGAVRGLTATLEGDLARRALEHAEAEESLLRGLAAEGVERREFYEGVRGLVGAAGLLGLGGLAAGIFMLVNGKMPPLAGYGALAAATLLFAFARYMWKRRLRPFIVFTAEGFLVADLAEPIPWTAIAEFQTLNINGSPMIIFTFAPDYEPPPFRKDGRSSYKPAKRQLTCSANALKAPLKPEEFQRELIAYFQAAIARAELKRRAEAADAVATADRS